jgi:hypothetical protein
VSSPFGPSTTPYKKSVVEPKGLSPDMSPDPIRAPAAAPGNFLSRITLTQVVSGRGGWVGGGCQWYGQRCEQGPCMPRWQQCAGHYWSRPCACLWGTTNSSACSQTR